MFCQRVEDNAFHLAAGIIDPSYSYLIILAGICLFLRELPHKEVAQISKCHSRLVRTRVRPCVAHLVGEAARAIAADAISVEAVIPGCDEQSTVAVNVDAIQSRAGPGQVRSTPPVYQVAIRSERYLAGRGRRSHSRRSCRSCSGCGGWTWRYRWGGCRRRCTYRLSIVEGVLLGTAANCYAAVHP